MAKEEITPESINTKRIAEIEERHKEEMDALKNQIQLLQIIATKASEASPKVEVPKTKALIQINAHGKEYFCLTPEEKQIFFENNPGMKKFVCNTCDIKFDVCAKVRRCPKCSSEYIYAAVESFHIILPIYIADKYLNDPENKKQFIRKGNK